MNIINEIQEEEYQRPTKYEEIYVNASLEFKTLFIDNDFGHVCDICDRLWVSNDLQNVSAESIELLQKEFPVHINCLKAFKICNSCNSALLQNQVPLLSKSNGYKYPNKPDLPPLDPITLRLLTPLLPFTQIRRLRYQITPYKIIEQAINIPNNLNNMEKKLPRQFEDDFALNIHTQTNSLLKTTDFSGHVSKQNLKDWLIYLENTPLYKQFNIRGNIEFLNNQQTATVEIEPIDMNDGGKLLIAQQQTMYWNECICFDINIDEYAEELSFPHIYYGVPRIVKSSKESIKSELTRSDRRGATPEHVLYMAAKMLKLQVEEGLNSFFKLMTNDINISEEILENKQLLERFVENNLSFLRKIPNSRHYWHLQKKQLSDMIRQLGKPTIFITLNANEERWIMLHKLLLKLNKNVDEKLIGKETLLNEDPVICCIYFERLKNIILEILCSNSADNPFGKYRVKDYFERIDFQHNGSPSAHLILWLENASQEPITENMPNTLQLIAELFSISINDSFQSYSCQMHKTGQANIPYWPMEKTRILLPFNKTDSRYEELRNQAKVVHARLSDREYFNIDAFLLANNLTLSLYLDVIRATLNKPSVFLKRNMAEIWTEAFNPWIASIFNAYMSLEYIIDEYSCAVLIDKYMNNNSNEKTSDLHKQIIKLQQDCQNKMFINLDETCEMKAQEAAWYLLNFPRSKSSREFVYVPIMWKEEREKMHIENCNIIKKYIQRDKKLEHICLVDFATLFSWNIKEKETEFREKQLILQYVNFNMNDDILEYKRKMVTLFIPFRSEETEILENMKFVDTFKKQHKLILKTYGNYAKLDINSYITEYKFNEKIDLDENIIEKEGMTINHTEMLQLMPFANEEQRNLVTSLINMLLYNKIV